jgi:hypothetical protein
MLSVHHLLAVSRILLLILSSEPDITSQAEVEGNEEIGK